MGPVGEFCYFCVEWVVHGPSAGNLLQYCLRALLWEYVMALNNYDHSEAACGECVTCVLHNFCHSSLNLLLLFILQFIPFCMP